MGEDFSPNVAALAGGVPVALLPVRLEARFLGNATELRVRIFPDQIHIDAHEPELTAAERDAGMAYWRERFATPDPTQRAASPWNALCDALGAGRAAWVARALTPANVAQLGRPVAPGFSSVPLRPSDWNRAARAAALPERWIVIGLRGGVEIFRKWSQPLADALDVTPAPDDDLTPVADDTLPLQPTARWLIDFAEAERVGMAVRVVAADLMPGQALTGGLDRLFVLGVDWTLSPDQSVAAMRKLFSAHIYTDGLAALDPGMPTNATAAARAGAPPSDDALVLALDPEKHLVAGQLNGTAADRLWRALGITPTADDHLTAIPGATGREQDVASQLANALWESTLGLYMTDFLSPLLPDTATLQVRDHVRRYLFPGGPYPALRIGKQPYGVLPVIAPSRFTSPEARFESELFSWLQKLRPFWISGATRAPRLGRSTNLDADLTALLQTTPLAGSLRFRAVVGPLTLNATSGMLRYAVAQEAVSELLGTHLHWPRRPDIAGFTAHPVDHPLRVPLVDPRPVPGGRLSVNYFTEIANLARTAGSYEAIKARENASTLLEALTAHAVARELHRADVRTIDRHRLTTGVISKLPDVGLLAASEFVGIETVSRPASGALVTTPSEAARVIIPAVTGQQTVRQFVTASVKKGATVAPDYRSLGETLTSLEWLASRTVEQLDRALRGLLDVYAYRLDAWYTSLAVRRLGTVRTAAASGIHIGAYGWLDDLRPAAALTSQGYLHAPSLGQAATAAVLRSGHLAHNDAEHKSLDLDLTSARVRTALLLLDGVADGQPLAALLGYRFERAVRTRSLTLAKYILPMRRLAPLRPDGAQPLPVTPSENLGARDVVDGVALLDRWRSERATLLGKLQPVPPTADQTALASELDRLADIYDAVADLLVAEAVHQNVRGNNERAGAVLAALDRQERPPRLEFPRTPRSGKSYAQRVLVLIGDESLSPAWGTISIDARAAAEPRLNAWIARLIGDPRRVRFAATASGVAQQLSVSLEQLALTPLSCVMAAHAAGHEAPSELEERLMQRFAARLTAPTPQTEITLLETAPRGSGPNIVGLGAFLALAHRIYSLITEQRPANAQDLTLPRDLVEEGLDHAQLAARANAVAVAYGTALANLKSLANAPAALEQALRDALWTAASFGLRTAVPPLPPLGATDPAYRAELVTQARAVAASMTAAVARERALVTAFAGGATAHPAQKVRHHTERMRVFLGEQFPILPRFTVPNAAALMASHAARVTLCGGDDLATASWLQRMALVRSGSARLATVFCAAELLRSDVKPRDLVLAQLPHTPGERWLALLFGTAVPEAELAIVAQWSGAVNFALPLAGLFCDGWSEIVPAREETTGIAFHYDAPGARPPQAVLLAVPPAATTPAWSVEAILDTIIEAHDLARVRAVGPRQLEWLGTTLPALYLPDSFSVDVPTVDLKGLVSKYAGANAATAGILGKA